MDLGLMDRRDLLGEVSIRTVWLRRRNEMPLLLEALPKFPEQG